MYLRFATIRIDGDSHKPQGVFKAAYVLLDSGELDRVEWKRLRELLDWFGENLPVPPDEFDARRAVFWFKSTARENITRVWELVGILRMYGYHVTVYKCRRLGNVCFRDKFQIAAYASDLDGRIAMQ